MALGLHFENLSEALLFVHLILSRQSLPLRIHSKYASLSSKREKIREKAAFYIKGTVSNFVKGENRGKRAI